MNFANRQSLRLVAPFGFYGWGNIGDEATLNGFARLLRRTTLDVRATIGSRNPEHTARVEPAFRYFDVTRRDPRKWYANLRADCHAVIGGTPIMDMLGDWPLCDLIPLLKAADRSKVPFLQIGIGVEDLVRDASRRLVAEEIAPRVARWSVRCDRDRARLEQYGVARQDVTVAADMAWLIEPAALDFGRARLQAAGLPLDRPVIGVNLVNENACFDRRAAMATEIAFALDELIDRMDARVAFLANEVRPGDQFDRAAASRVAACMRRKERVVLVPGDYLAPREMMSLVGCCTVTLSMRYHFCLFSALQGVPFVAIERSAKVSDLCWDLGWEATVRPLEFEGRQLVEHALRSTSDAISRLAEAVRTMEQRALRNVAALMPEIQAQFRTATVLDEP
jgi:polysaccharide pyruvyl transferase WcaK-like protein